MLHVSFLQCLKKTIELFWNICRSWALSRKIFWFTRIKMWTGSICSAWLWKFFMYFLKSISTKKQKVMMCMSSADTQNRLKNPIWSFSLLSYKCSPEAERAASASLPKLIKKLMFVVFLGNLAFTCIFFFHIWHLLFISMKDRRGLTSGRRW